MREFIIFRHGFDESTPCADQGLSEKMAVARIEAESADEACAIAGQIIALGPNQSLSAAPADVADAREQDINRRVEAL